MTENLKRIIEEAARERGVSPEMLVAAIETGIALAAQRKSGERDLRARFNVSTGAFSLTQISVARENPTEEGEISLESARTVKPDAQTGDQVAIPFDFPDLGRLAAQTTRKTLLKNMEELQNEQRAAAMAAEHGRMLIANVVGKNEKDDYLLKAGDHLAVLTRNEQAFRERFENGEVVKVVVVGAERGPDGPLYSVSRTHPLLLRHLFTREVPEISDGSVVIKALVRDTGGRSKVAVAATNPAIDPVGTCIGTGGSRVKNIIRELKGENIDIIPWSDNPEKLIADALAPAKVKQVKCDPKTNVAAVYLDADQQAVAVGKKGLNIRLASRLTHWTINIQ